MHNIYFTFFYLYSRMLQLLKILLILIQTTVAVDCSFEKTKYKKATQHQLS